MRAARAAAALTGAALVAVLAGCTGPAPTPTDAATPTATAELAGELTISAAASLATGFDEIATAFEAEHPGVDVRPIEYDGSSTLATQLIEGKPADVFAAADRTSLQRVIDAGLVVGTGTRFATNTLVVIVPDANPAGVTSIADLADPAVRVVLCDAEVPCGRAAARLLELNGVVVAPVSLEQNVSAVLTKVAAGEADAGLVYATEAARSADVESFVPEHAGEVVNEYPIAMLDAARNPDAAAAFIAFVTGPVAQGILAKLGFGP